MQPTEQERIELTPIDAVDPDDMPTQRFRIDDLEPTDRAALLDSIRRLDAADAALDLEVTLDESEHEESRAPTVLSPRQAAQPTPALAFGVGFGVVALIQLAWWLFL